MLATLVAAKAGDLPAFRIGSDWRFNREQIDRWRAERERKPDTTSDVAPVLTVKDLSNYLQLHQSTIYRLVRTRQLPAFRFGSDWRFNVEAIDRWLIEREKPPRRRSLSRN